MSNPNEIMGMKDDTFCMLLHLSQLLMFALPALGLAVPIVLWAITKDKYPIVDRHGKIIFNWLLTFFCLMLASTILFFMGIGLIIGVLVVIAAVAFAIIGALKANDGIVWEYRIGKFSASYKFLK